MVVLDTDILVGYVRGNRPDIAYLQSLIERNYQVKTTAITACEIFRGRDQGSIKGCEKVEQLIQVMDVLPLDLKSAFLFRELFHSLAKKGIAVGDFDLMIAAIALANGESLATRNVGHFLKVPGLTLARL